MTQYSEELRVEQGDRMLVEAIINDYHTTRLDSDYVSHILSKPRTKAAFARFRHRLQSQTVVAGDEEREAIARDIARVAGCQVGSERTTKIVDYILSRRPPSPHPIARVSEDTAGAVERAREVARDLRLRLSAMGINLTDDARTAINRAVRFAALPASEHGREETWDSINQWCDDTFGKADIPSIIARAREEWDELEAPDADHAIEAADVVIILCRIPGFAEALQRKMAINRARKWRTDGKGTGYHIPEAALQSGEAGA